MGATVTKAEHVGKRLGRAWRGFVRQEMRVTRWMIGHGVPRLIAASILWTVKLAVLAILLYAAFWMAVIFAIVLIAAAGAQRRSEDERPKWLEQNPDDHQEDLFYHPLSYNDDPDPRFRDPRLGGK